MRLSDIFQRALLVSLAGCGADKLNPLDSGGDVSSDVRPSDTGADSNVLDAGVCGPLPYSPTQMDADLCARYYRFPCGLPQGTMTRGDCYVAIDDCYKLCNDEFIFNCFAIDESCVEAGLVTTEGGVMLECNSCIGNPGRAPEGLAHESFDDWASRAAWMEAASIFSFRRLARELAHHGAPASLVRRARAAARDEIRHARMMRVHARTIVTPAVRDLPVRDLESIAIENAVEGCVNETYAAFEAHHQSLHAPPKLARTMRAIASDEIRHAQLAWAIAGWLHARLASDARVRVARAHARALAALEASEMELDPSLGLPRNDVRRAFVRALRAA